jgi:hypothetical protein
MLENQKASRRPAEPTSRLLGRLEGALADSDRTSAIELYTRLRDEDRLDGLNLAYLEIEIAAAFRDWNAILGMPHFADIVTSPRPASVTVALLEAIYAINIKSAEERGEAGSALAPLEQTLRELLVRPRPPLGPGGLRIAQLVDRHATSPSDDLEINDDSSRARVTGTDFAVSSLIHAVRSQSLSVLRTAVEAVEELDAAEREALLTPGWVREMWNEIAKRSGRVVPPNTWLEWLVPMPYAPSKQPGPRRRTGL